MNETKKNVAATIDLKYLDSDENVLLAKTDTEISVGLVVANGSAILVALKENTKPADITPGNLETIAIFTLYGSIIEMDEELLRPIGDNLATLALRELAIQEGTRIIENWIGDTVDGELADYNTATGTVKNGDQARIQDSYKRIEAAGAYIPLQVIFDMAARLQGNDQ